MPAVSIQGDNQHTPLSFLIALPTWVGDFVMATPALRAIRRRFDKAHIVFLMEPNLAELVRGGDWMDECMAWPAKEKRSILHREYRDLVFELRRRRFDWAVLFPNSFRSATLARLAGCKRRVGYDRDGRGWLLTDRVPVKNRDDHWWRSEGDPPVPPLGEGGDNARTGGTGRVSELPGARIWPGPNVAVRMGNRLPESLGPYRPVPMVDYYADLAEALGCDRPGDRLELFTTRDSEESLDRRLTQHGISAAAQEPLVVISPGAKFGASKCWPAERFATLADRLIESHGATVVITCGPGEERIGRDIAASMKNRAVVFDKPILTLGELKSLIRRCHLLICNDAGPRHFAKAFNAPVVTVFGPTHPDWTATSYADERIIRIDLECSPCQQKTCPLGHHQCMTRITPDIVYAAAVELVKSRREADTRTTAGYVHG
jgi:heptosyltransferase-2